MHSVLPEHVMSAHVQVIAFFFRMFACLAGLCSLLYCCIKTCICHKTCIEIVSIIILLYYLTKLMLAYIDESQKYKPMNG